MSDKERHLHLPHLRHRSRTDERAVVAPGWYDDPTGRFEQRYWDGAEWTTEVIHLDLKQFDLDDIDLREQVNPTFG